MLSLENSLAFARGVENEELLRNFWAPEDGFIWSTGKWCEISFSFRSKTMAQQPIELICEFDVFKHPENIEGQNLLIYLNGLRIGSIFCVKKTTCVFPINGGMLSGDENVLTIDTPDACSPSEFGSDDKRVLGVQLYSLQFRSVV